MPSYCHLLLHYIYMKNLSFVLALSLSLSLSWGEMMGQIYTNFSTITGSGANHYITMGGTPTSSPQERLYVNNNYSSNNYNYSITAFNGLNSSAARALNASATGAGTAGYFYSNSTTGYAGYFVGRSYVSDKMGIGTTSPNVRLELSNYSATGASANVMLRLTNQFNSASGNTPAIQFHNGATSNPTYWQIGGRVATLGEMRFIYKEGSLQEKTVMYFEGNTGKVRIGDISSASNDYLLFVKKGIATGKVFVNSSYADYVFLPDYRLPTLEEVRSHIDDRGHLPGMTSQAEIDAAGGFEVGEIAVKQMEKIEELYLYVLQLHDRIAQLEAKLAESQSPANTKNHE